MDESIQHQCKNAVEHFLRNRGIVCPICPPGKNADTTWRLPFADVKHKLSAASVASVAKAECELIADDAYKAAIAAHPKKDHVDVTLDWLLEPEKCPHCDTAIEVR
jgi:hypothetical protein